MNRKGMISQALFFSFPSLNDGYEKRWFPNKPMAAQYAGLYPEGHRATSKSF
jgi:hypothetical protein